MKVRCLPMVAAVLVAAAIFFSATVLPAASSAIVEHTFVVSQMNMTHLCKEILVTVVNGQLPGPVIEVTEGDLVVVNLVNKSPYNMTIHWHGVKQRLNCWNDGVPMLTQLPILPNNNFTYRFDVSGQEGTLWWHAHVPFLRATLHGALIIRPRLGADSYPFPKPDKEIPIIIGEWWEVDLMEVERQLEYHLPESYFSASTINGKLGDLYNCSGVQEDGFVLDVEPGKTYLLRVINAALYSEYYFRIAGHKFTVVASDASYVKPFTTDIIPVAPGETVDALVVADAPPGRYYMVAMPIQAPKPETQAPVHVTRGTVQYRSNHSSGNNGAAVSSFHVFADTPMVPEMPDQHDKMASFYFHRNLTMLHHPQNPQEVPKQADEHLFITLCLGSICRDGRQSCERSDMVTITVATMNNISFKPPILAKSMLEMQYYNTSDLYAFQVLPDRPLRAFNYTDVALVLRGPKVAKLEPTSKATVVRRFRYGTTVDVVFQSTAIMSMESNPMHLHGHNMFVLAQGDGNYNAARDVDRYNLVDPPVKNTVQVPSLGWTAIRFVADNPGIWFFHCHFEFHLSMGMATVFIVENGPTGDVSLPPPPSDFKTFYHDNKLVPNELHVEI